MVTGRYWKFSGSSQQLTGRSPAAHREFNGSSPGADLELPGAIRELTVRSVNLSGSSLGAQLISIGAHRELTGS